jgi:hypothetical protein
MTPNHTRFADEMDAALEAIAERHAGEMVECRACGGLGAERPQRHARDYIPCWFCDGRGQLPRWKSEREFT